MPLEEIEKRTGSLDRFFELLIRFVKREDDEFLEKFENTNSILKAGVEVLELKPNFFGFGLNINALIKRISNRA